MSYVTLTWVPIRGTVLGMDNTIELGDMDFTYTEDFDGVMMLDIAHVSGFGDVLNEHHAVQLYLWLKEMLDA